MSIRIPIGRIPQAPPARPHPHPPASSSRTRPPILPTSLVRLSNPLSARPCFLPACRSLLPPRSSTKRPPCLRPSVRPPVRPHPELSLDSRHEPSRAVCPVNSIRLHVQPRLPVCIRLPSPAYPSVHICPSIPLFGPSVGSSVCPSILNPTLPPPLGLPVHPCTSVRRSVPDGPSAHLTPSARLLSRARASQLSMRGPKKPCRLSTDAGPRVCRAPPPPTCPCPSVNEMDNIQPRERLYPSVPPSA